MKFPAFIPAAVRHHVSALLPPLDAIIVNPNGTLPRVVPEYIKIQNKTGEYKARRFTSFLDEHLATIIDDWSFQNELVSHRDRLIRFVQDERLQGAYARLVGEFLEDESWHNLIWASSCAAVDFDLCRKALSNAAWVCAQIGDVANHLSFLLDKLLECGVSVPDLESAHLLINRDGDTYGEFVSNLSWMSTKDILQSIVEVSEFTHKAIGERKLHRDREFSWGLNWDGNKSRRGEMIMAAVRTRQSNAKTDYLRALACGLSLHHKKIRPPLQRAMADFATVALNEPDLVVSYDDVKALLRSGQASKGDSTEKLVASFPAKGKAHSKKKR